MFELYTEKARRVLFFARYEASHFGSPYIETEHILLGLLREDKALTRRLLRSHEPVEAIRRRIAEQTPMREPSSVSVDLPLSSACKRVLGYAAEEVEHLSHSHLGTEHLLLGLLREESSLAARLLSEHGISLERARASVAESANSTTERPESAGSVTGHGLDPGLAGLQARIASHPRGRIRYVFVNADGEELAAASNLLVRPGIGEAVTLLKDGSPRSYRVTDVVWTFTHADAEHTLSEIVIRLAAQA